jgi:hypothetical protein
MARNGRALSNTGGVGAASHRGYSELAPASVMCWRIIGWMPSSFIEIRPQPVLLPSEETTSRSLASGSILRSARGHSHTERSRSPPPQHSGIRTGTTWEVRQISYYDLTLGRPLPNAKLATSVSPPASLARNSQKIIGQPDGNTVPWW